jgi:RNA polymerase sigma-70 factor (ECF subfamily)
VNARVILVNHRRHLKFYGFSAEYIQRLKQGDPFVEEHFNAYFGELIFLKLRNRLRAPQLMDDIRQETLLRVIRTLRTGTGIEFPERFGAYVNAVCNNVTHELLRQNGRFEPLNNNVTDPVDTRVDLDLPLITEDRKRLVHKVLDELPSRDREILKLLFLEERTPADVCQQLKVDAGYLRVLLHRAKSRFKSRLGATGAVGD